MLGVCGAECKGCGYGESVGCKGCLESNCCPAGKECFVAKYIKTGGMENYETFKKKLIEECNKLNIPGMPEIKDLNPLNGAFVNLEYPLFNGATVKFLDDREIYLGMQVESEFNDGSVLKCFGIVANMNFIIVSEYGANGADPELIMYKKL